ncbi:hypothetical protein EON68_03755 [archaeon]|nr:MAG: hypothetical protein EON68_03755 [archaeon]
MEPSLMSATASAAEFHTFSEARWLDQRAPGSACTEGMHTRTRAPRKHQVARGVRGERGGERERLLPGKDDSSSGGTHGPHGG